MRDFTANPVLFRIKRINKDVIDSTHSPVMMLGSAFHKAMEVYYGGSDEVIVTDEQDAIVKGLAYGLEFIEKYPDGFIGWNTTYQNKQQVMEKFSFAFNAYVKEIPYQKETILSIEEELKEKVDIEWRGERLTLPIPLVGYTDKIVEEDGKLIIEDYKTTSSFSDEEKIDGYKILQAVVYYLLVYAKYGREPYALRYREVKVSKNRDGGDQVKTYEIVFAENELFFDFFFRYYDDMTRALNGEMVYMPNITALYDNEVAILAYIHRLDIDADLAEQMKKEKVSNITDVLKAKVANASSMKKLLKTVEKQFVSAKTLNYETMEIHERIEAKLAEHGMLVKHAGTVSGATVELFKFSPSIGIKMSKIASYGADIEQVVGISGVRILAPIPNSTFIGVEVPKTTRTFYNEAPKAHGIVVPIGMDTYGELQTLDIESAPHILIAGTTGGGKSYMLRSILNSLTGNADFWLADPKGVELHDLPHERYAEEPDDIRGMLEELTTVMDRRYAEMKPKGLRKWEGRKIICVIDEYADFVLQNPTGRKTPNYHSWNKDRLVAEAKKRYPELASLDIFTFSNGDLAELLASKAEEESTKYMELSGEQLVVKLAQKARAAGIHLIVATQSPRADIITGAIKANIPTRIALRTSSEIESRIVLDVAGAEKLQGKGDALLLRSDVKDPIRLQGFSS